MKKMSKYIQCEKCGKWNTKTIGDEEIKCECEYKTYDEYEI